MTLENATASDLTVELIDRLGHAPLPEPDEEVLLGAILGDDHLATVIGGTGATVDRARAATVASHSPSPAGAYLRAVTVTGFRGIGPTAKLSLEPGPGLTVVCGRNGSGKSSFAEALEVLLTGGIRRFADRSAVWQESWRCLHGAASPEVTAELVIEGVKGAATVRATWDTDAKRVTDRTVRVSVPGEQEGELGRLGWGEAMSHFRPFLSHAELEVLLARPADLYDQLNSILGLQQIAEITARLAASRKRSEETVKAPKALLPGIKAVLESSQDERATEAAALLSKKEVDIAAVEALATGAPVVEGEAVAVLSRLRDLHAPDGPLVQQVSRRLASPPIGSSRSTRHWSARRRRQRTCSAPRSVTSRPTARGTARSADSPARSAQRGRSPLEPRSTGTARLLPRSTPPAARPPRP